MQPRLISYTTCPCCGSPNISFQFPAKDYVATGETFSIWECAACTVRFTQSVPDEMTIGRYYDSEDYMSHATDTSGWFNRLYQQARKYSVGWRYRVIKKFGQPNDRRLLDVGTGAGTFAHFAKRKGWQVSAVEPDEDSRLFALQNYSLRVQPMNALTEMSSQSFEVITLWHVLEHVHQLQQCLQQINRLLTDDGTLFIAVPNYQSKDARYYGAFWDAYDVPRHLYHFSPAAILSLLAQYGFQPAGRTTFWLDPFYVCLRSERHKTGKQNLIAATRNGLVSCITGLRNIEQASAVTYVLKKKKQSYGG